jgi:hypothetical protein
MKTMILLCLSLAGCTTEGADEWLTVCSLYSGLAGIDVCETLPPPVVVEEAMPHGKSGYYRGGPTIHISKELRGDRRFGTLVHEMVHYIDYHKFGLELPGYAPELCATEDMAWFIEGVWWGSIGKPELAQPSWWLAYPHCWSTHADQEFLDYIREMVQ